MTLAGVLFFSQLIPASRWHVQWPLMLAALLIPLGLVAAADRLVRALR
jgi:hypothetical protein